MRFKTWSYVRKVWTITAVLAMLGAFLWWQNNGLCVTRITVPAAVSQGIRIVHLSDFHGAYFGLGQQWLGALVDAQQPDIIVMTGDFIDRRGDERAARILLNLLTQIAPVYCVTGNHEWIEQRAETGTYEGLLEAMEESGAVLLRGETIALTDEITLTGADDPAFVDDYWDDPELLGYGEYLEGLKEEGESFSILLMHRPELFHYASQAGFDLTVSGHAHGGQIRLPFVGGLFTPGEGFLPEYTAGLYTDGSGAQMVVSRGLGSSGFPQRIFNRPEIVVIDIVPMS